MLARCHLLVWKPRLRILLWQSRWHAGEGRERGAGGRPRREVKAGQEQARGNGPGLQRYSIWTAGSGQPNAEGSKCGCFQACFSQAHRSVGQAPADDLLTRNRGTMRGQGYGGAAQARERKCLSCRVSMHM
ncbi:unnamed protein product [Ectocarpus sp. 12 AP-2014]